MFPLAAETVAARAVLLVVEAAALLVRLDVVLVLVARTLIVAKTVVASVVTDVVLDPRRTMGDPQ
jgi:uncharacterized membrane protein